MTKAEAVEFWFKSSKEDLKVAKEMFVSKHYDYCLFFCHLSMEKFLKGTITKNDGDALPTHDLVKLAKLAGVAYDRQEMIDATDFAVGARYKINKDRLYRKATKPFTTKWLVRTEYLLNVWKNEKI